MQRRFSSVEDGRGSLPDSLPSPFSLPYRLSPPPRVFLAAAAPFRHSASPFLVLPLPLVDNKRSCSRLSEPALRATQLTLRPMTVQTTTTTMQSAAADESDDSQKTEVSSPGAPGSPSKEDEDSSMDEFAGTRLHPKQPATDEAATACDDPILTGLGVNERLRRPIHDTIATLMTRTTMDVSRSTGRLHLLFGCVCVVRWRSVGSSNKRVTSRRHEVLMWPGMYHYYAPLLLPSSLTPESP